MTAITITNPTTLVTFTFQDGDVQTIESEIFSGAEQVEFPLSGPMSALLFDFNGPLKSISMDGALHVATSTRTSSGTTTTMLQQKQWLEQNVNGAQSPMLFTSNYDSESYDGSAFVPTKIMIGKFRFKDVAGEPNEVPFSASLLVGTQ